MKLLSIIIPCYNAEYYLKKLLDCLAKQITDDVEVIVVDDGSDVPFETDYDWVIVERQSNQGVSSARNKGLDMATGKYVAFIDADDLVSENYFSMILEKIRTEKFDYCYMSWQTMDGQTVVKLADINSQFPKFNLSVWNRVYKRSLIGRTRFNTKKHIAEDAEFIRAIHEEGCKKSFIPEIMYYYSTTTANSLSKRFQNGRLNTRRVIYYFPCVKKSMSYLIEEFKQLNKSAEVILMTNQNELPQLEEYALVTTPCRIHGTELRGFPTNLFIKVVPPVKADIVIWTERTFAIGGIETFNYNLCKQLSPYYDIVVLYGAIDETQRQRLSKYARVIKVDTGVKLECDTLVVNRITDTNPPNVDFKQKIQMVHSCKWKEDLEIPKDNDYLIPVSQAVANSYPDFKTDYTVIHNVTNPHETDRALILVSATRTGTNEKGQKRMIELSNLMKKKGLPFIWFCFCDNPIQGATNITFLKPTLDIAPYLKCADYLAQLSDHEGFCYSIVEALEQQTPILVTDLAVLPELGFEEGVNGYKIPWEITDDFDVEKIFKNQLKGKFEYHFDNESIVAQWRQILGEGHPNEIINEECNETLKLRVLITFNDILTHELISKGSIIERKTLRAYELMQKKFVELVIE